MSSTSNSSVTVASIPYSRIIIFDIFIVLLIPSMACSILVFFYFIRMPQLRQQQTNHIILAVLIVLFIEACTDLPIRLYYLLRNTVLVHTGGFCLYWNWNATVLNVIGLHLMALASIERYLFVFHSPFLSRHRLLITKLPMIFSIIYPLAFYTGVIFGSWWCTNVYDYASLACGAPCYLLTSTFLSSFGILTHHVLPVFIILCTNVILVIRVWQQKSRMNQANTWRKNILLTAQLLSVALIYLVVWLPQCVFFLMITYGQSYLQALAGSLVYEYTGNFTSLTVMFCPFITLAGLPQMRNKMKEDMKKISRIQIIIRPNIVVPINGTRRTRTMNN